ncbi:MAG: glycine--tRNA ligase subunit beta [Pseudomonadota bacterium]|nr:glycine--tRNA ligase subunit beta [Pseudomonadota bacterium]
MAELLIELFSEEIPSRFQSEAAKNLERLFASELSRSNLAYDSTAFFYTPRRLTLVVSKVERLTSREVKEVRGPNVLAPEEAINGFKKTLGVTDSDLYRKVEKKGEFFFSRVERPTRPASDVISEILETTLPNFSWPKSMRWGSTSFKWVRPLHSILCILTDEDFFEIVPVEVNGIRSGDISYGHRFLSPEPFSVLNFEDYTKKLRKKYVILDAKTRKDKILNDAQNLVFARNMELIADDDLLDEIVGLVEWPVVLLGEVNKKFLSLPPEILKVVMKEHQRFFSVRNKATGFIESYLTVANIDPADNGQSIIQGNTRVLNARLSDAQFFWYNDITRIKVDGLSFFQKKLEAVTFHNQIGSQAERVSRIQYISLEIADSIGAPKTEVRVAASICKLDLVSEMVYEFPELQGVMGSYFAREAGLSEDIARASASHYSPLGPSDNVPTQPVEVCIALADKIDMLSNFFAINLKPTGSKDPFALRRAALGIVRISIENKLNISIKRLLSLGNKNADPLDLFNFLVDRARAYFIEKHFRLDILKACLSYEYSDLSFADIYTRILAISEFIKTDDSTDLIRAYKRAVNILNAEEKRDTTKYFQEPSEELFKEPDENSIYAKLLKTDKDIDKALEIGQLGVALEKLNSLRPAVDTFFENVQINSEDELTRRNRLCLLNKIKLLMHKVALFSEIEIES